MAPVLLQGWRGCSAVVRGSRAQNDQLSAQHSAHSTPVPLIKSHTPDDVLARRGSGSAPVGVGGFEPPPRAPSSSEP